MQEIPLEIIDFAEFMADEARKISRKYYRNQIGVEKKADNSPVTEADRKIEDTMRKLVQNNFPDHGIFGEEFGQSNSNAYYQWVIDPIDGTKSFIAGRPIFGTLISLVADGRPVLGVIDQPVIDERWVGVNGETKFNGKIVNTRRPVDIRSAIVAVTCPSVFDEKGKYMTERLASETAFTVYGGDCYSYGQLALGLVDIVVESNLKPYDFCALVPIVENAGGVITDWKGDRLDINSGSDVFACGDPALHKYLLEKLF